MQESQPIKKTRSKSDPELFTMIKSALDQELASAKIAKLINHATKRYIAGNLGTTLIIKQAKPTRTTRNRLVLNGLYPRQYVISKNYSNNLLKTKTLLRNCVYLLKTGNIGGCAPIKLPAILRTRNVGLAFKRGFTDGVLLFTLLDCMRPLTFEELSCRDYIGDDLRSGIVHRNFNYSYYHMWEDFWTPDTIYDYAARIA